MAINLEGIVTWLKGWFYEKGEVNTLLNAKVNQNQGQANYNVVTDSNGNITTEAKPTIPDISGLVDTAGTGLSKSGTTLNHSNSVTAQTSPVFKKIEYDGQGHITGTANVTGSDLPSHSHYTDNIIDDQVYSYIQTRGSDLGYTLSAIDSAIGDISSIRAIEVVSTLPTASASSMGKLYIINENSKVNVYYTEQNGSSYSWHKMDTDILDELSISWNDITNKPSTFSPSSHSHSISDVNNLQTSLDGKAPTSHASSETTYGVGTTSNYGHNKIRDNLTASTLVNGESLSAHQGYILKGLIDDKQDNITSIVLVPKSTDANGKIIFYTGDEPT